MFSFMSHHRQAQEDRREAAEIYRFRAAGKFPERGGP